MILLILIVSLGLIHYLINNFHLKRRNLPPGPPPIPIIGNLLSIDYRLPHQSLHDLGRKYGGIFTLWVGPEPIVMVTKHHLIKKYFNGKDSDALAGRAANFAVDYMGNGNSGILNGMGPSWREQRRFVLHALRDLGFGRNKIQPAIQTECAALNKLITGQMLGKREAVMDILPHTELSVGNVLTSILLGFKHEPKDPQFEKLRLITGDLMELFTSPKIFLLLFYPYLRYIPLFGHFGFDEMRRQRAGFWKFFDTLMDQHYVTFDEDAETTNFTSAYIKELKKRRKLSADENNNNNNSTGSFMSMTELRTIVADFLMAGMDTTIATLQWSILMMVRHPRVHQRVYQEIRSLTQQSNQDELTPAAAQDSCDAKIAVNWEDRINLPYTCATIAVRNKLKSFIFEIQRITNVLPCNLQHSVMKDINMEGYQLKRGLAIIPQVSAAMIDPDTFPNPHQFNPRRHLTDDGKLRVTEELNPFGIGKRQCAGESLARMQLFLFFTNLMSTFEFQCPPGHRVPGVRAQLKFTRWPEPFEVLVRQRHWEKKTV